MPSARMSSGRSFLRFRRHTRGRPFVGVLSGSESDAVTNRLVWYVVAPVAAAIFLFFAALDAGPTWRALQHDGVNGWFTPRTESCGRASCHWDGTFLSDDDTITRTDVWLDGAPAGVRQGVEVRAFDTGDRNRVFGGGPVANAVFQLLFAVGSTIVLIAWLISIGRLLIARGRGVPPSVA